MKYLLTLVLMASTAASAQLVAIDRVPYGSGTPGLDGIENALRMDNDIYHAPQYLPNFPTAASIWPRVVEVPCKELVDHSLVCEGFNWTPKMGRGEYLFFKPTIVPAQPQIVERIIERQGPPLVILKEVPIKRKSQ